MNRDLPEGLKAIESFASLTPQAPALLYTDGTILPYDELWRRLTDVSKRLGELGMGANDTVAVLAPQSPLQFISVMGTLCHCGCFPMQPRTVIDEVRASLFRTPTSALIVSEEFAEQSEAALEMGLVVVFARLNQTPREWRVVEPTKRRNPSRESIATALSLLTSATTGLPRIVQLSTINLDAQVSPRTAALKLKASDRELLMTSLSHGLGIEIALAQFLAGGSVIATNGFDPKLFPGWLDTLQPTWYECAPPVHEAALSQLKTKSPRLPLHLRFVVSAGGALSNPTKTEIESILRIPVFNDYGSTETGSLACDAFPEVPVSEGSAGCRIGPELGVVNDFGELVPAGEEGEIVVRGPGVCLGYLNDQEANANAFRDGWFRTGDAGRLDSNGDLFITGRIKEMINRGGEKISPSEVDSILKLHPCVIEAAAFPVPHATLGEDIACAVVLDGGQSSAVSQAELRRFAKDRLAIFKIPHHIYFVESIPRGELGKPQRWLLTKQFDAQIQQAPPRNNWNPRLPYVTNDLNYKIREIWGRILNRDDIDLTEDFFEAGGDSLLAISMLAEVDLRCGSRTSELAANFIDEPTIEHLTELVGTPEFPRPSYGQTNEMQIFPLRFGGANLRMYCVPADEDEGLYFRRLAKHLQGNIDLSIVRPASTFYSRSLFTFERAADEMVRLILQEQVEGPFVLAGYCFGGIVAFETARRLASHHQVRVVLFDAPLPGHPAFGNYFRNWVGKGKRKQGTTIDSGHLKSNGAGSSEDANGLLFSSPDIHPLRGRIRRSMWHVVSRTRPLIRLFESARPVQSRLMKYEEGYFPFYLARPIDAPIIHFHCMDESDDVQIMSRVAWRKFAQQGVDERSIPGDHMHLLHESNLQQIVDELLKWIGPGLAQAGSQKQL